jgi:O-antigen ligase
MFGAMGVALWLAGLKLLRARYKRALLLLVALFAFGLAAGLLGTGRIGSEGFFDPYRWATYKSVIMAISSSPWLGTGWGTFPDAFPTYRTAEVSLWGTWPWAHSTPLEIAMEMGIPAALVVCLAAVYLTATVISRASLARTERRFVLAAAAGVAILALLQTSIDFVLQIPHFIIIFAAIAAVGLSRSSAAIPKVSGD